MLNNSINLSIIIPIHNVEKYLAQSLDSLTIQTPQNVEFLCINDGSTDNSEKIIQEYTKKDSRFILINQENQGVAKTRQNGINIARGEWIGWLDPDDFLEPTALEVCINTIKTTSSDVIEYSELIVVDEQGTRLGHGKKKGNTTLSQKEIKEKEMFVVEKVINWGLHTKLYKKQFLIDNKITFSSAHVGEDFCYNFLCYINAKEITILENFLYNYRYRNNSLIHTKSEKNSNYIKNIEHVYNYLTDNNLMEKYYDFYKAYRLSASVGAIVLLPKNAKKTRRNVLEQLKLYYPNNDDWKAFKRALKSNSSIVNYRNPLEYLFSIKNKYNLQDKYKIITILGIKLKFKKKL